MDVNRIVDLRDRFLQGMSCAAATVNVVTTDGPAGRSGVTWGFGSRTELEDAGAEAVVDSADELREVLGR